MILTDKIGQVTLSGDVLRIECVCVGPGGQEQTSGWLVIPAARADAVLQALGAAVEQLKAQRTGDDWTARRPEGSA